MKNDKYLLFRPQTSPMEPTPPTSPTPSTIGVNLFNVVIAIFF